jgi:hypothetical protein
MNYLVSDGRPNAFSQKKKKTVKAAEEYPQITQITQIRNSESDVELSGSH